MSLQKHVVTCLMLNPPSEKNVDSQGKIFQPRDTFCFSKKRLLLLLKAAFKVREPLTEKAGQACSAGVAFYCYVALVDLASC